MNVRQKNTKNRQENDAHPKIRSINLLLYVFLRIFIATMCMVKKRVFFDQLRMCNYRLFPSQTS